MTTLFGKNQENKSNEITEINIEKTSPFDLFILVSEYNYLQNTDQETFYFVMKPVKTKYYTEKIFVDLEEAMRFKSDHMKIVEKTLDVNNLWMLIKIMSQQKSLFFLANVADQMLGNINNKAILLMLEKEIPKRKYFIKRFHKNKKVNNELLEIISNTMEIDPKNVEDCLEIANELNIKRKFIKHFDRGD